MPSAKVLPFQKLYKPSQRKKKIVCEGLATSSLQDPPELCPQKEVGVVTFCTQGSRPAVKISRFLKIKCFKGGVLNSSVDCQQSAWLLGVLAVLEFRVFVKAGAGGLHDVVFNPAVCAQTLVPAVCLGGK